MKIISLVAIYVQIKYIPIFTYRWLIEQIHPPFQGRFSHHRPIPGGQILSSGMLRIAVRRLPRE